jgi:hypothetical protein
MCLLYEDHIQKPISAHKSCIPFKYDHGENASNTQDLQRGQKEKIPQSPFSDKQEEIEEDHKRPIACQRR